jgi:threonine dehydrogenase-like Zn-dependent dehydrogenase
MCVDAQREAQGAAQQRQEGVRQGRVAVVVGDGPIAIALAVSWKPLVQSNVSAVTITTSTIKDTSISTPRVPRPATRPVNGERGSRGEHQADNTSQLAYPVEPAADDEDWLPL